MRKKTAILKHNSVKQKSKESYGVAMNFIKTDLQPVSLSPRFPMENRHPYVAVLVMVEKLLYAD